MTGAGEGDAGGVAGTSGAAEEALEGWKGGGTAGVDEGISGADEEAPADRYEGRSGAGVETSGAASDDALAGAAEAGGAGCTTGGGAKGGGEGGEEAAGRAGLAGWLQGEAVGVAAGAESEERARAPETKGKPLAEGWPSAGEASLGRATVIA